VSTWRVRTDERRRVEGNAALGRRPRNGLDSKRSLRLRVFIFLHPFAARSQRERRGAVMADPRTDSQQRPQPGGWLLQEVSNAMVALHKEQFGRGPTK